MEEMTFRQMMEKLEEITLSLEREDLELEEGLKLFEEGVELVREARRRLDAAGSKVEKLIGSMEEGLRTVELELGEGEEEGESVEGVGGGEDTEPEW